MIVESRFGADGVRDLESSGQLLKSFSSPLTPSGRCAALSSNRLVVCQEFELRPSDDSCRLEFLDLRELVRPERFELPTTWFEARCSIQLSYGRAAGSLAESPVTILPACCRRAAGRSRRSSFPPPTRAQKSTTYALEDQRWPYRAVGLKIVPGL